MTIMAVMEGLSEILKQRISPGVLIFSLAGKLLYMSQQTWELFGLFSDAVEGECSQQSLPGEFFAICQEVQQRLATKPSPSDPPPHSIITTPSGETFSLRAFAMNAHDTSKPSNCIMVLMEKIIKKHEPDYCRAKDDYNLSKREVDVLRLVCMGCANRDIAERLFISEDTVKVHLKKIMRKMDVNSRSEIIVALQ